MASTRTAKILSLGIALFSCGAGAAAKADWHSFWHGVHVDYARGNAWPQPFTDVDARAAQAPFAVMKHNGWRAHNTVGHELFRDGDAVLTAAGNRRVSMIAMQSPAERRTIYVLRGRTEAETEARLASVRHTLASLPEEGAATQVMVTDIEPAMAHGGWVTHINRRWMSELPAPKLPSTSAAGSAGATGP
jgi:hypothetical protein